MQPRNFDQPATGEELFGSRLDNDDLALFEIYTAAQAEILETMRLAGQLKEGGPAVDLDRLRELRSIELNSDEARRELANLLQFIPWYRNSYAMNTMESDSRGADSS